MAGAQDQAKTQMIAAHLLQVHDDDLGRTASGEGQPGALRP
jgi:hypothetical protein